LHSSNLEPVMSQLAHSRLGRSSSKPGHVRCTLKAEVNSPIVLNARLGTYTNFVNLMGFCGVAIPSGFRTDGLPLGVTVISEAFAEAKAAAIAATFHRSTGIPLGATSASYPG
jgi:allophanate hydrolase